MNEKKSVHHCDIKGCKNKADKIVSTILASVNLCNSCFNRDYNLFKDFMIGPVIEVKNKNNKNYIQ